MHDVSPRIGAAHGKERAGSDMKRDELQRDAARLERLHQGGREMQTSRWRCYRALLPREDSLIVDAVLSVGRPLRRDIGRKGHRPQILDCLFKAWVAKIEGQSNLAFRAAILDRRRERVEQAHS